ncbi:DUF552 domain-containing protein [Desulfofundulus thermobenzoicus]|uniref:Cell division protein SepF n=1 Tax=Desulfofundulus thermobenzoicus TaxID=29376 RepID=A0A6N7ISX5_9FIRM|nr:cell division protein SepF [Desulfofundulus thermobenzoicus]MQL53160.1 DUF552 domain-containing protein [Desulfofundulus thermobenzoicus]HHW44799.1 cell division protein SepF [Desulfotomaculum sp.]
MGFEEEPAEEMETGRPERVPEEEMVPPSRRRGQVVSLHTQRQVRVIVAEPKTFDEVQSIAEHLKNRRPVIVNLERADGGLARRVLDFVLGATYALDGNIKKVGNGIFLSVPSNMEISGDIREQVWERGILSDIE